MTGILYVGNSNVIELQELTNSVTDVVDEAVTVTVTLYDTTGTEVTGQIWPATMTHATGGTYRVTLDNDAAITAGKRYTAKVDASGTGGQVGHWEYCTVAQTRR